MGAMALGIGGMVGGGIFAVLGTAATLARGGTPIAFLIAGAVALLTAHSYAKLSVRYPSQGGTVVYIDRAFGVDLLTGTLNVLLWLSYLGTLSLYAVAFADYGSVFFTLHPSPWLYHGLVSLAIALPVAINLFNAEVISKAESLIVALKVALLLVVVVAGASHVQATRLESADWSHPLSLMSAGMVIFVAYEGFELIGNAAQDVAQPARTLPRAFYGSVILVACLYFLVATVTVGTLSPATIVSTRDYALAAAAMPALGTAGFTLVAIAAVLATLSAINATIYGNARLGFILARDGELPDILERKAWNAPVYGVLLVGLLAGLLGNLADLTSIAILGSAGFLAIFAAVNAAAWKLAAETNASRILSGTAFLACLAALVVLVIHTCQRNKGATALLALVLGGALLFELAYPRLRGRPLKL